MPVSNKKHTTPQQPQPPASQPQLLPGQAEFHQRIRELARVGLRALLESVMREELQALLCGWVGRTYPGAQGVSQRLLHA